MAKQDGLEWVSGIFGLEPRWTREPNIAKVELLARKHLKIPQDSFCHVTFYAQGAFNKLFKVETEAGCSLMRVTLPVDPSKKTNSEVATINFVHQNTDMPVPRIFAFDESSDNELGFEWILMEMLPGVTLRRKWRKLSDESKRDLVKQVAKYHSQLFCHKFSAIGNIFVSPRDLPNSKESSQSTVATDTEKIAQESKQILPVLGQLVSMIFFWGDHINQDVSRSPFTNSEDWICARLSLILNDQEIVMKTSDDEDDIEEAQDAKENAEKLLKLLPSIFPPDANASEQSVLFHDDLSMQNILVDDDGKITGIIDWECVSALPLWRVCGFPEFLQGRNRNEEPKKDQYAPADEEDSGDPREEALDNEGINSLYWEHLLEYELSLLRDLFLKEMEDIAPQWLEELEKGEMKSDFEAAVQNCDNSWRTRQIKSWLDAQERGEN